MTIEYKGFHIKPHKELPLSYIVVTAGQGGKIPDVLSSHFTTPTYAKENIDKYLNTKEGKAPRKKEELDAKTGTEG